EYESNEPPANYVCRGSFGFDVRIKQSRQTPANIKSAPPRPTITLRHDRGYVQGRAPKQQNIINYGEVLIPPLPTPALVSLPVRDLKTTRFAVRPRIPGGGKCVRVVAIENEDHPIVDVRVSG